MKFVVSYRLSEKFVPTSKNFGNKEDQKTSRDKLPQYLIKC